jgi:hypothetical protein
MQRTHEHGDVEVSHEGDCAHVGVAPALVVLVLVPALVVLVLVEVLEVQCSRVAAE